MLAWRFLRYAIDQGGSALRESLRAALEQAAPRVALPSTRVSRAVWNQHGRLTPRQGAEVIDRAWRELILPAAARLLELPLQVGEAAVC